jgi:uncharacterized protein (DUF1684 family)
MLSGGQGSAVRRASRLAAPRRGAPQILRHPLLAVHPALRFDVEVEPAPTERLAAISSTGEPYPLDRIGRVSLPVGKLDVFWVAVYGGGVFLPFRDGTSGAESYGGGRYLLDTVKGADLGGTDGRLVVDFNYAYNPSCAYDPQWSCPLAPPADRLMVPIMAGERYHTDNH